MNIQIIGDNFNVSARTKNLVAEKIGQKLDKLLTKFDPQMRSALLKIEQDKLKIFKVNFDMNLPGKEHIYAETTHKILKSALIDLNQQVEKQIKKYKADLSNYSVS